MGERQTSGRERRRKGEEMKGKGEKEEERENTRAMCSNCTSVNLYSVAETEK